MIVQESVPALNKVTVETEENTGAKDGSDKLLNCRFELIFPQAYSS